MAQAAYADSRAREVWMESHFALGLLLRWVWAVLGWLFSMRCGIFLEPGMANMWRRGGERRRDSPDGLSLAFVVPCAGRGFRGRVLSLVSAYGPVSGAGFDEERRIMLDSLTTILGLLPERSVWIVGGDC